MGALIPLALTLAPEIGKWLFGDKGEQTAQAVAQVVQTVTGTTDDAVAQQVIARDPTVAAQLRVQLAQLAAQREQAAAQATLDALKAQIGDVQNARAQTVALAQAKSAVAWAPPIVSVVVLVTFGLVMWAALTRSLPAGSETILNMLLGTLAAMATSVVGYWVGSSAGSERKTDLLYNSTPTAASNATGAKQ
jgi:FlaG/FlaF family flagellin (archaellin)